MNHLKQFIKNHVFSVYIAGILLFGLTITLYPAFQTTRANIEQFCTNTTASSTTTPNFMTPGTATTTLYAPSNCTDDMYAMKSIGLLVQFSATNTTSTLLVTQEVAQGAYGIDCYATPLNCDWYAVSAPDLVGYATSTIPSILDVAPIPTYTWKFASTTQGGATNPLLNRAMKYLTFNSPARYTRFIFSLAIGGSNGAVYAQVIGKKEIGQR